MTDKTCGILKKYGWHPGRKVAIDVLVNKLEERGFEVFEAAKRFIEEYGMLDIDLPINPKIPESDIVKYGFKRTKYHTTDIEKVITGFISRDTVKQVENIVDEKIVIVGELYDGNALLLISESGKMFTEHGFFGNNSDEFWDKLTNNEINTLWEVW